jgi:hypothetical protein
MSISLRIKFTVVELLVEGQFLCATENRVTFVILGDEICNYYYELRKNKILIL